MRSGNAADRRGSSIGASARIERWGSLDVEPRARGLTGSLANSRRDRGESRIEEGGGSAIARRRSTRNADDDRIFGTCGRSRVRAWDRF